MYINPQQLYYDNYFQWLHVTANSAAEACPIGVCLTLSGTFPYAPYSYLTNWAGVSKHSGAVNNNKVSIEIKLFKPTELN